MDMVKYTIIVFVVAVFVVFLFAVMFPTSFDQIRKAAELAIKTGQLTIGGKNPRVDQIYIEDKACTNSASGPGVLGLADSSVNKVIKAYIADDNGNCNAATATAYVCDPNAGTCNQATRIWQSGMTFTNSPDGNVHCNFTVSSNFPLWFYYRWGDWKINVTVNDPSSLYNNTVQYWYYNQMSAAEYPYNPTGATIDFGALPMVGGWNDGRGGGGTTGNYIKNTGNIRVNVTWNSTDFSCTTPGTCGSDQIPITNSPDSFCVDRDTTRGGGAFSQQCMNANELIQSWYIPVAPASLKRCGSSGCATDEDGGTNAYYLLYWHIYVPNVREGTYQDNIQWTGMSCPTCGG